ncbi:OmpA family protein [Halomonas sp. QX-2]|jgi:chemotaxis protein MotB|uniref:OmpA family protein n=2 Tax=Vreelandella sedimenti TaxID=2729618 RepID=A0A7Z0NAH2_9GAMM|nr:OmpA family protein [Halomonas sp. UBA3173]NYT74612.1 OmpA family protein [Halomonas sedimenti]|tara:strand:- start:46047 stop:47051 length:1005 start_codon:yes stop_codon:yes gene_type:complete
MLEDHRGGPRHDSLMSAYHESDSGSGWMISYLDIMTLLVALFVVIIAAAGPVIPQLNQKDSVGEDAGTSSPTLGVPLPEALAQASHERESVAQWSSTGLNPMAVSAALGVAGLPKLADLPRRVSFGVPPLLAAPLPPVEPVISLPKLLMPAGSDDFTSPLADYMVVLTDHPPVNVQAVSDESVAGALALNQALSDRVEESTYLPDLEGVEVSRVAEGISLRVQDQLLFPSAAAELTNDGSSLVGSLLETIQRYDGEVWVEGHSDSQTISTEEFSSNWALSSARAIAIVEALEAAGVDAERLRAVGLAATKPLESNTTAEGRARNRRVEVVIHVE